MSDLKHQTPQELEATISIAEKYSEKLNQEILELEKVIEKIIKPYREEIEKKKKYLGGNKVKLEWARHYLKDKTHTKMTLEDIERALGFKVDIVE